MMSLFCLILISLKQISRDIIKVALSGMRQILANENSLKMMKKAFFHHASSFRSQGI